MNRLFSIQEVWGLWPETSRPSLRTLREFADRLAAIAKGEINE